MTALRRALAIATLGLVGLTTGVLAIETRTLAKVGHSPAPGGRIAIRDFAVARDGTVSGTLCNVSNAPVRDVRLVVERTWVKAVRTGVEDPGRTEVHTVEDTIAAGGQRPFRYRPTAPLPNRTDGHFDTSVGVVHVVALG